QMPPSTNAETAAASTASQLMCSMRLSRVPEASIRRLGAIALAVRRCTADTRARQGMHRGMSMWRVAVAMVLCLLALPAPGSQAGIERLQRLPDRPALPMPGPDAVRALPGDAFEPVDQADRLAGGADGRGWWRLQPAPATQGDALLLVYHPYSARVTVMAPPGYRPVALSVFDRALDPRFSRRALAFPLPADGPVYVGVE